MFGKLFGKLTAALQSTSEVPAQAEPLARSQGASQPRVFADIAPKISAFGARPQRPMVENLENMLRYTGKIKDGCFDFNSLIGYFIEYGNASEPTRSIVKREMDSEITWLHHVAIRLADQRIFDAAASLADCYVTHYCQIRKGEDKVRGYERVIGIYEDCAKAFPNNAAPLISAAMLIRGAPQMRDKQRLQIYVDRIQRIDFLTHEQRSQLSTLNEFLLPSPPPAPKVKAPPKPIPALPENFNYSVHYWPPDERTRCRAIYKNAKKNKDMHLHEKALQHLFRVAFLYELEHSANSKIRSDALWDFIDLFLRDPKVISLATSHSYAQHGRIKPADKDKPFLSETDYKHFELSWGATTKTIDTMDASGLREALRQRKSKG